MFKKLLAVVVLASFAAPVFAADMDGTNGVGGQIGYVMPGGDLGDNADAGLSIGAHYFRGLKNNFGLLVTLDNTSLAGTSTGADYTNLALGVNGVYMIPADLPVQPFALLGLSYNMQTYSPSGSADLDENGLGFTLGIGANKQINDKVLAGVCLSYKTFPTFDFPASAGGGTATGNAITIGFHVGYKLGA